MRAAYDKYGETCFKKCNSYPNPDDIMHTMLNKKMPGPKKTKSVVHPVKLSLEDIFNGKSMKIKVTRDRLKYIEGKKLMERE